MPLLQCEHLSEYFLGEVGFASLCEFRSKMGFKFLGVKFMTISKDKRKFKQNFSQDSGEVQSVIQEIRYNYQIDSHIQIQCKLSADPQKNNVIATYNIHAPASTLKSLHLSNQSVSMRDRLKSFVQSIQTKDQHFQLIDQIIKVIRKT